MNLQTVLVPAILVSIIFLGVVLGLRYSQAAILFGIVAAILAFTTIPKVVSNNWAMGLFATLAIFASYPVKKLFRLEGFAQEAPVTLF